MSSNPSYDNSGISWGPWSRLPNGQWHREGQDMSGNWYQEDQDEDPRNPRTPDPMGDFSQNFSNLGLDQTSGGYPPYEEPSLGYGGYDQVPTDQPYPGSSTSDNHPRSHETERGHKSSKSRRAENSESFDSGQRGQERHKSSRSSKSDNKGSHGNPSSRSHGKSAKTSKTDEKGKGRDTSQMPTVASSSKHISNVADDDDPGFPGSYPPQDAGFDNSAGLNQSLQDVADMYSQGTLGGSSSNAMLDSAYSFAPQEDSNDQITPLPGPSSYVPPRRGKSGPQDVQYNEDWSKYRVENSNKFKFGTVFKCMWSEPMGDSRLSRHNKDPVNSGTSISEFGARNINGTTLYEGIRRFIVIDGTENGARNGNSICVPIATYKKQGCMKPGVKAHHHGIVHTHDRMPMLLNGERDLGVSPIRLVVNQGLQGIERLSPESRVNYSKHVTIEHNSSVHLIGHIHPDDLNTLAAGVDGQWEERVGNRKSKKDKKQERSSKR